MLNYLLLMVLIAEVAFFTYFDKKVYGNYFSPVLILSYPLLIIVSLVVFFGDLLGFKPLNSNVLIIFFFGLGIFWSGSLFWSLILPRSTLERVKSNKEKIHFEVSAKVKHILMAISWAIIVYMLLMFYFTLNRYGGIEASSSDEFTTSYGGGGLQGHVLGLVIPLMIFFIGIVKKKDFPIIVTILFLVIISLFYRVKTWLFIPIIGGILLRFFNERKVKFNIPFVVISVAVVMLLFGLTYAYGVKADNFSFVQKLSLLLHHFVSYVYAGILGFSEHLNQGLPIGASPKALFMPLVNMWNFIVGGEVTGVISPYHVFIDLKGLDDVNVKTFFGTILINGGYFIGIVYMAGLSILLYLLWILASSSRNYWLIVMYIFFASALVIGWFDFYYNQLTFNELPVYLVVLMLLSRKKQKIQS